MRELSNRLLSGIIILFMATPVMVGAQASPPQASASQNPATTPEPDHTSAYYHYMLARRYKELAGIYNRQDFVDKAISEYKQAMQSDPDSLFLRVELADLYWRVGRVGDAVREADAVLKVNPNQVDAHRLLGHIYLRNLGEAQANAAGKESLQKAITHFEALERLDPSDTDSFVILGRLYKASNQPAKAEEAFKRILGSDPTSRNAISNLAQLYMDQGEYAEAIEVISKVPDNDRDGPLLAMLAEAYGQSHQFDKSIETFQKALAADPENQDIRRVYAATLKETGKPDLARQEYQNLLKADPEDGQSVLAMAQLDEQDGRWDQARQELEKARTLLPDSVEIPYQQAVLEDTLGNDDKAIQILQSLIKQSEKPDGKYNVGEARNRAVFLEQLGLIYQSQEKWDQAIAAFQQVETLGKDQTPRGEALIIETLRLSHQPQKAAERADQAVQKFPEDRSLQRQRAKLMGDLGHTAEAIQQLKAMLKGDPSDGEVYLTMTQVYLEAKRFPEAEEVTQKALALTPKPDDQKMARFMLGSVYEREKKYDLAEEQFKKVLATDPLNSQACNYLGYMLADRGVRLDESVKYIQKALQLEPNNGAYLDSLGWAYYKMERFDLAEGPLEKAVRLTNGDPTVQEHLGRLYVRLGKKAEAEQQWEQALKNWPNAPAGGDFDADEAAKLRKDLDELKQSLAKGKTR